MKKLSVVLIIALLTGCATFQQMISPPELDGPYAKTWFAQELIIKSINVMKESESNGLYSELALEKYKTAVCKMSDANSLSIIALASGDFETVEGQTQIINAILAEIQRELIPIANTRAVAMQRSRAISPGAAQGILAGIQLFNTWMEMKQESQQAASDGIDITDIQDNATEINASLNGYCI